MKCALLATAAFGGLLLSNSAWATGSLLQIAGADVSGTTEYVWYLSRGSYTLLSATAVNTTVSHTPYAYVDLFYLPSEMTPDHIVVGNQAGTTQTGYRIQQVVPVGAVVSNTANPVPTGSNIGGSLYNLSSSDTSGTTEYVWSVVSGVYTLLGSSSVNSTVAYSPFAYNILFYLPLSTPVSTIVVTNQAGAFQTRYALQQEVPRGVAASSSSSATTSQAVKASAQNTAMAGQLMRAHGSDVSGTTAYVWNHIGTTYTLLAAGPVNAADPQTQYGYNVLFFKPSNAYLKNIVVTDQAGTFQHGVVIDGKTPTVVAKP